LPVIGGSYGGYMVLAENDPRVPATEAV